MLRRTGHFVWSKGEDDDKGCDFEDYSCVAGGKIVFNRACPACHSRLDKQFDWIPTFNIALIGGRAAGKTAYLHVLTAQVKTQVSERGLGSVELLEESQWYLDMLDSRLQHNDRNWLKTGGGCHPPPPPIVFRFTATDNRSCFVAFYDISSALMDEPEYIEDYVGVQHANIMMLMLDVNMLNNGVFYEQVPGKTHGLNDCNDEYIDYFMYKRVSVLSGYCLFNSV